MRSLRAWTVRIACILVAGSLAGCAAPVARTGSISGHVVMRGVDVRDVVVWAEAGPVAGPVAKGMRRPSAARIAGVARRDTATMATLAGRFEPHVLAVAPGTVVRFENRDRLWHQVIGRSTAQTFDAGACAPGHARCVTFDRAGAVPVYCQLDRALAGWVFVAAVREFTRPDRTGAFELRDLPRGAYTLHAWHPAQGARQHAVILNGGDAAVSLDY
jgi:plastocyanin